MKRKPRIGIVDDDVVIRNFIDFIITRYGMTVTLNSHSYDDGVKTLISMKAKPDLIIVGDSQHLAVNFCADDVEILRRFTDHFPSTRVIYYSHRIGIEKDLASLGITFLKKPSSIKHILKTIQTVYANNHKDRKR